MACSHTVFSLTSAGPLIGNDDGHAPVIVSPACMTPHTAGQNPLEGTHSQDLYHLTVSFRYHRSKKQKRVKTERRTDRVARFGC
jgi:hypothetical protein